MNFEEVHATPSQSDPRKDEDNISISDHQQSQIWPTLSSMFQKLNTDSTDKFSETQLVENTTDNAFIPMLPIHNDPVHFLKNQETYLLHDRLPNLITMHSMYLQNGDSNLSSNRQQILNSLNDLSKNYEALNEIYFSEKYSKLSKYELFIDWINKKSNINNKIDQITNDSSEGQTYKTLLSKSNQITSRIAMLEEELKILKNQNKLISHQLLETKSLLDIKLNMHNDELENLERKEKTEIDLMFKENQIRSNKYSDVEVSDNLKIQINALDSLIDNSTNMKEQFEKSEAYLSDVFDTLDKMEKSIQLFIEANKTDRLESLLTSSRLYLLERLKQAQYLQLNDVTTIITDEIRTIEKAMVLLNIEFTESSILKDNSDNTDDINSLNLSNDSTDYYPNISSMDNISVASSNKQSLQVGKSPPQQSQNLFNATPTTATTTRNVSATKTTNKFANSKYDTLIKGIKISKGDKAE